MDLVKLVTHEDIYINNKPYIVLFTREGNIRTSTTIDTFKPYFFVKKKEYPKEIKEILKSLRGEDVVKYEVSTPNEVPDHIGLFSKTWEDDIKYRTRYLVDKIDKIEPVKLRVQYTDIETSIAKGYITSIQIFDNYLNKVVCFVWRKDFKPGKMERKYTFPDGYSFSATIYKLNSERSLLDQYIKFVQSTQPDILTGWYFIDFDMPEIIGRINAYQGLSSGMLSPLGRCYVSERGYGDKVKCKGRVVIDMLQAYRDLQQAEMPDESLEAISQKVLKVGKVEHDENLDDLWLEDIERFVEYGCKDAVLVYRIDKECHVLDHYDTMRRFTGSGWENMYSNTQLWDIYMLRKVKGRCVLPSKRTQHIPRIPGAEVFMPSRGIHEWICLLDLKSLYPSIIITFNMSPETILEAPGPNCNVLKNGIIFNRQPLGLLPEMLLELFDLRAIYQKEMNKHQFGTSEYTVYNNLQYAIKQHMNALYGAMLFKSFRLSNEAIGRSITFCGREIILWIRTEVQKLGFKVLYGDTDSVFYHSKGKSIEEIVEEFTKVVDHLNKELPKKIAELGGNPDYCKITIQPEKIYRYLLMALKKDKSEEAAKKTYAGRVVWAGGKKVDKVDIKGFALKKSNSSPLTQNLGDKVFSCIFGYEPLKNLTKYFKEAKSKLKNKNPDYKYIGMPQGFGNIELNRPHPRGAKYANEYLGEHFKVGDKPKLVYLAVTPPGYPSTDVVCYRRSLPAGFVVNWQLMFEKSVIMKFENIFEAADLIFEKYAYGQTGLDQF